MVDGITGAAVSSSIRIEAPPGDKLEIGSVDATQVNLASTDPAVAQSARKRLEDELDALGDQRAAEGDVIKQRRRSRAILGNWATCLGHLSEPVRKGQGRTGRPSPASSARA